MKEKKYLLLYGEIKEKILNGEYKADQKLPSKRVMADRTGYSTVTVETAYGMLEDEGYVTARCRSGYFVCPLHLPVPSARQDTLPSRRPEAAEEEPSFPVDFETSVWFKTVRKVLAEKGDRLFVKAPAQGCAVLRNAISDYLYRYRGMTADPKKIIIGSGAEQLYETAVKLLGRHCIFGIEDPCYEQIPSVYRDMGVQVQALPMGKDGIRSEALQQANFDVLHVTPFHSYPSGVTATVAKRHEYLRWAREGGHYILEDDFDSEFYMPGHPIESLYFLDGGESVIYLNTFSKSLSPAMRIGYMILPDALFPEYEKKLGCFSCSVPVPDQYFLAEFIENGSFERHLNRQRRRLQKSDRSL